MLRGEYVMSSQLGSNKVCASAARAAGLVLSPAPANEPWNYSLGHWVGDDPTLGDHAFSSAGGLGFYPWIDRRKTWYGVLARRATNSDGNQGFVSLSCGRLIRQAWVNGVTVTSTTPARIASNPSCSRLFVRRSTATVACLSGALAMTGLSAQVYCTRTLLERTHESKFTTFACSNRG